MAISLRKRVLISSGCWYFICGIEYSLILASIEHYVSGIGATTGWYGFCLASFPLAGLIFAPIFGRVTDASKSIKFSLLIATIFSIIGNAVYSFFPIKQVLVLGRFLSGIGNAIDGSMLGYTARINTKASKASTFALMLILKQVGTISVPLWQLLIKLIYSKTYPLYNPINGNYFNSESFYGITLSILWIISLIISTLVLRMDDVIEEKEGPKLLPVSIPQKDEFSRFIPIYINEPFSLALMATFAVIIQQSSMEAIGPPFYKSYFGWGKQEIGLLFMCVAVTAIIGYSSIKYLAAEVENKEDGTIRQRVETKKTFVFGVISCFLIGVSTSFVMSNASFRAPWLYPAMFGIIFVFCFSLPLLMVSCAAIIAAATPSSSQNSAQSIRFVAEKFAQILSPTWVNSLNPASTSGYIGFLLLLPANIIFAASICSIYASYKFI